MAITKGEVVEQFRSQAIREAAMRVVTRKGYDHVTVQDIADEAGIAKGTVYLYFKSREDIFEKTMSFSFEELREGIREAIARGGTFGESVERVVQVQLDYFKPMLARMNLWITDGALWADGHVEYAPQVENFHLKNLTLRAVQLDYLHSSPPG